MFQCLPLMGLLGGCDVATSRLLRDRVARTGTPGGNYQVEVDHLRPGPRLRVGGIKPDHLNVLVQSGGNWPPIVVRREDNTIIDGCYRYLAAQRLGHSHMDCIYYDGGSDEAFMEGLRRNLHHGLPLSLKERESAARTVLAFHLEWSDRRLGEACGLSPGTVGQLRSSLGHSPDQNGHLNTRWGRDGKRYHADLGALRQRISTAIREKPEGSLRSIAQATGTSPATVRAVKARLAESDRTDSESSVEPATAPSLSSSSRITDAALLSTREGTSFAKWFERTSIDEEWRDLAQGIPVSRIYEVADEARRRAQRWLVLASWLETRATRP